jgi:diaminopropionate ammonia-lyase
MVGLNCGTPSLVAWPDVSAGFDVLCAISDELAIAGMRRLAAAGIEAGECSGGSVGAAGAILADPQARAALGIDASSAVCVLLTEGVTDPEAYARVVSGAA